MAYSLPNGDITFSSGEQLASAKMNDFSGNQSDLAAAFSTIHTKVTGLSTVASTGDYNDLLNTPTIPVPGNGELDIKVGGVSQGKFKANQSSDTTIDITIPAVELEQTTGDSTTTAMSQNAVTEALDTKQDELNQSQLDILSLNVTQADINQIATNKSDISSINTTLSPLPARITSLESDNTTNKNNITLLQNNKANKGTRLADYNITDAYTIEQIDAMLTSTFHYKGSVADVAALEAITDPVQGDTYNVQDTGDNYTWDGSAWDKLAGTVDLTGYYTKTETDNKFLEKRTSGTTAQLYGVNASNASTMFNVGNTATANQIAQKGTGGVLVVGTPTANNHATTKSYVDTLIGGYTPTTGLAAVATSGSYNDLLNKPTIPAAQVQSDWKATSGMGVILNKPTLATVATSGSYTDLSNKPTIPTVNNATLTIQKNGTSVGTFTANSSTNTTANITVPTKVSELTNDSAYITKAVSDLTNYTKTSALATVATSGKYSDLSGTPTIPTVNNATLTIQKNGTSVGTFTANASSNATANITVPTKVSELTNDSAYITKSVSDLTNYTKTSALATVATSGSYNDLSNKPSLATVATSGSYSDLSNKPTIPTVNNATLTIQKNGTTVKTFTANASSNVTANITVPTKVSELTNDSAYITKSVSDLTNYTKTSALATVATSGKYSDLSGTPTIPTVNNATLTIQKNGTTVKTFTANASSNVTANITVPTFTYTSSTKTLAITY